MLLVTPTDTASIRVAEKIGMHRAGDRYHDGHRYFLYQVVRLHQVVAFGISIMRSASMPKSQADGSRCRIAKPPIGVRGWGVILVGRGGHRGERSDVRCVVTTYFGVKRLP
jgi:hypothetical protein